MSSTISSAIGGLPFLRQRTFRKLPNLVGSSPRPSQSSIITPRSWNSLSGSIPPFLLQLTFLTFTFNFSGSIPPPLANLHHLGTLHLDRNQLTGPIPNAFSSFPVICTSHMTTSLVSFLRHSVSPNGVSSISRGTRYLGMHRSFQFVESNNPDRSRNQFAFDLTNATFPVNLPLLDMNHNMINGEIPAQINELADLIPFNVSYNRLCGKTPAGSVTAKFDEYNCLHNKCLCGAPLPPCK